MPEPADRPPLRDQIAEALYRHTMDHAAGGPARLLTRDETVLWENSLARADAVMHVVEAETAAKDAEIKRLGEAVDADGGRLHRLRTELAEQRQRAEEAEDQRDQALAWQDTAERELRNAERRLDAAERIAAALEAERDQARDAIADERRGRLAAEAAVRRVKHVLAWKTLLAGPQAEKAVRVADVEAALDAEQPKETP